MNLKLIISLATALLLLFAVVTHQSWINGSWYWRWPWRDLSTLPAIRFYPAMLLAASPMIAAWFLPDRARKLAIALIMLAVIAMKLTSVAVLTKPASFDVLSAIVKSPSATSYYTDAATIWTGMKWDFLSAYPEILQHGQMNLHTLSKPPGAVTYYLTWIAMLGFGDKSAIASGIVLGIIAAFSVPAIYLVTRMMTGKHRAAMTSASLLAVCPGFVLIFPTLDACYPILSCAMIVSWHRAITRNNWRYAMSFGAILFLTSFCTYNLLPLGALLAAWSFLARVRARLQDIARMAVISLSMFVALSIVLWIVTGFNPIATFSQAYHNQKSLLAAHPADRPYPATIWFDLVDFALGAGWVIVPLIGFGIFHRFARDRGWRDNESILVLLSIAQIVLVAVLGILQSETARAWNFMLPLLILPAAIELARWPKSARITLYFGMLCVLLAIGHNLIFLVP